jgi:hypothetical protein
MIAAVLESGEPRRLYTALSLLVSAAVEGTPVRALAMFGALGPLLDDDLLGTREPVRASVPGTRRRSRARWSSCATRCWRCRSAACGRAPPRSS